MNLKNLNLTETFSRLRHQMEKGIKLMKNKFVIIGIVGFLLAIILYTNANSNGKSDNDFKTKIEQAKNENKKVVIDFYTDWCGWCKKMDKETYTDELVKQKMEKDFVFIKINAESNDSLEYDGKKYTKAQLARAFGVTGYPATVFLDTDSKPITLVPGYLDKDVFLKILTFIGDDIFKTKKTFEQFSKEFDSNK